MRILLGLRSGIPDEEKFALHHLVRISHERGDKYKFEQFPGLIEGLLEKVYEIGALFYEADWSALLKDEGPDADSARKSELENVIRSLSTISPHKVMEIHGNFESQEFGEAMCKINETCLVLRNMIMLDENAEYVSHYRPMRDFIAIALNLPQTPVVVEMKHYMLEIAEQLTRFWTMDQDDPLYQTLLAQLHSEDRGLILGGLRALTRISISLEQTSHFKGVPPSIVENMCNWLLLDDEELTHACLDFLYQYTADVENVETLVRQVPYHGMMAQLGRFLLRGAREVLVKVHHDEPATEAPAPASAPTPASATPQDADAHPGINVPQSLFDMILSYEEPERSTHW